MRILFVISLFNIVFVAKGFSMDRVALNPGAQTIWENSEGKKTEISCNGFQEKCACQKQDDGFDVYYRSGKSWIDADGPGGVFNSLKECVKEIKTSTRYKEICH